MIIENLALTNFRSYKKQTFQFAPGATLILGPNASGKTNLLEALFFLATGKSFRAERDRDAVSWEREVATILANVVVDSEKKELTLVLTRGMLSGNRVPVKKYQVNNVAKRMMDFVGNVRIVLFHPEDLQLITGSPGRRRNYLDSVLLQVDREYRRSLRSYEKGLRQRNRILKRIKDGEANRSHLLFWDQLIIKSGNYLTKWRQKYIDFINKNQWIADKDHTFSVEYDMSSISKERIEKYARAEVAAEATLVGPHRDDIKFRISNDKFKMTNDKRRSLSSYGSRGEQRLGVLWLKLAELAFVEQETSEKPVLLLDDIFSELDQSYRDIVFSLFASQQTIVTTADPRAIPDHYKKRMRVVELNNK